MSKELEALKYFYTVSQNGNHPELVEDAYRILKDHLTPPTSDEVCEVLSDWLKEELPTLWNYKVYHDNGGFHYYNNEDYEIYLVDYDEIFERIFFKRYLPPHLVTMIGRFYEVQQ